MNKASRPSWIKRWAMSKKGDYVSYEDYLRLENEKKKLITNIQDLEQQIGSLVSVIQNREDADKYFDQIKDLEEQIKLKNSALKSYEEAEKYDKLLSQFFKEKEKANRPSVFINEQLGQLEPSISRQEIALRFAVAGYGASETALLSGSKNIENLPSYIGTARDAYKMADAFLAAGKKK